MNTAEITEVMATAVAQTDGTSPSTKVPLAMPIAQTMTVSVGKYQVYRRSLRRTYP